MSKENLCNDGKCKINRLGTEHPKHLNENIKTKEDKDEPFRNPTKVQGLFLALVILGGVITFVTNNPLYPENPINENPALRATYTTIGLIIFGLAFAVLNKGTNMKMYNAVERIEKKLDKILEHRDDALQNK